MGGIETTRTSGFVDVLKEKREGFIGNWPSTSTIIFPNTFAEKNILTREKKTMKKLTIKLETLFMESGEDMLNKH